LCKRFDIKEYVEQDERYRREIGRVRRGAAQTVAAIRPAPFGWAFWAEILAKRGRKRPGNQSEAR
jgi:hypothetical protein